MRPAFFLRQAQDYGEVKAIGGFGEIREIGEIG